MDLVPPEALPQAIREVSGYLKANYPRFEAAFHSPAFYYDNSKLMFTFKDDELIVYVRIPVVSGEHLFRVYEVLSFPVPINMGNHAQKDALQIVNLPAHVAVSLTKQYYIPLFNVNWAGCYGQTIMMCKDLPYMKKVTDRTCIASLLWKDRTEIVKLCLLDYLLNPDFGEMAIYLEGGEVLVVSAEKEGQLICGTPAPCLENNWKLRKDQNRMWLRIPDKRSVDSLQPQSVWSMGQRIWGKLPRKWTTRGKVECPYMERKHDGPITQGSPYNGSSWPYPNG